MPRSLLSSGLLTNLGETDEENAAIRIRYSSLQEAYSRVRSEEAPPVTAFLNVRIQSFSTLVLSSVGFHPFRPFFAMPMEWVSICAEIKRTCRLEKIIENCFSSVRQVLYPERSQT